jgi:hypothetical protein
VDWRTGGSTGARRKHGLADRTRGGLAAQALHHPQRLAGDPVAVDGTGLVPNPANVRPGEVPAGFLLDEAGEYISYPMATSSWARAP